MTTTSVNIAGAVRPLGGPLKRPMPGCVCNVDEIQPTAGKKRKAKNGMFELFSVDGEVVLEAKGERSYIVNGQEGIWKTIKGRPKLIPNGR